MLLSLLAPISGFGWAGNIFFYVYFALRFSLAILVFAAIIIIIVKNIKTRRKIHKMLEEEDDD